MHNMSQMKCISDVVTEYAFQITRPSVRDYVAEILEKEEVQRRHHTDAMSRVPRDMQGEVATIFEGASTKDLRVRF